MEFTTVFGWIRLPSWAAALFLGSVLAAPAQTVTAPTAATQESAAKESAAQQSIPQASTAKDSTAQSSATQAAADKDSVDQDSADQASTNQDSADEPDEAGAVAADDPDVLKGIDVDKLDWDQLAVDGSTLTSAAAAKKRAANNASNDGGPNWSSNVQGNGASNVTVKQSVSPIWDAQVGANMTVAPEPRTMSELLSEKAANGGNVPQSSGNAFATATAPGVGAIWDKTAVEARVDPGQDQSKLGATLTKSVPMSNYSLTLQNGYNVTQQGTTPIPGIAGQTTTNYATDQSAKVSIGDTGTSLTAGQSLSSTDDKWQRQIGAEQKLLDDVTVSATVGVNAQGATNKSVTAGFKKSW